jgi:hypothetical protein
MGHHRVMPGLWKQHWEVSIKARRRIRIPLTVGPDDSSRGDLSIGVSTVTPTPKGTGQYIVPGIRLRMIKGDDKGMTKDEVVPKTSLRHAMSWLNRTYQTLPRLNRSSNREADGTRCHTRCTTAHASADDSIELRGPEAWPNRQDHKGYEAQKQEAKLHPSRILVLIVTSTLGAIKWQNKPHPNIIPHLYNSTQAPSCNTFQVILQSTLHWTRAPAWTNITNSPQIQPRAPRSSPFRVSPH